MAGDPCRAARTGLRPLQRFELDSLPMPAEAPDVAHRISLVRLRRVLGRESAYATPAGREPGVTPRLYQKRYGDEARFEISTALEGSAVWSDERPRYASGTGFHGRIALETDRWLAFSHLTIGYQDT